MRIRDGFGGSGCMGRTGAICLVVIVIVLVAGIFAARTRGAKELVTDWLSEKTGMEVAVNETRIGLPYVLVAEGVDSKAVDDAGDPFLHVDEVRMWPGFSPFLRVRARGVELTMLLSEDGKWRPESLAKTGRLPGAGPGMISRVTRDMRRRMVLEIEDSSIVWRDWRGQQKALVSGLCFGFRPVDIPGKQMYYYHLSADVIEGPRRSAVTGTETEWLSSARIDSILLDEEAQGTSGVGAPWREAFDRNPGEETGRKNTNADS
jgi:hypothetical protein